MQLYRYFRWLSLDVVLGAIVFLEFLRSVYELVMPVTVYLALAIAVWLIYTVDHLIDSENSQSSDPRRQFHQIHYRKFILFTGIAAVAGLINIYYLPVEVIRSGSILAACCITYLMLVYFVPRLWFKELIVAAGYATGIFLAPISLMETIQGVDVIIFIQLAVLALVNLLVFSVYDRDSDLKNGFGSIALRLGPDSIYLIWTLLFLLFSSSIILGITLQEKYQMIQIAYLIMAGILGGVLKFNTFFGQHERFRTVGDAVFFVPAIFLFI